MIVYLNSIRYNMCRVYKQVVSYQRLFWLVRPSNQNLNFRIMTPEHPKNFAKNPDQTFYRNRLALSPLSRREVHSRHHLNREWLILYDSYITDDVITTYTKPEVIRVSKFWAFWWFIIWCCYLFANLFLIIPEKVELSIGVFWSLC